MEHYFDLVYFIDNQNPQITGVSIQAILLPSRTMDNHLCHHLGIWGWIKGPPTTPALCSLHSVIPFLSSSVTCFSASVCLSVCSHGYLFTSTTSPGHYSSPFPQITPTKQICCMV